jgi:CHAT domain-containing protein/tetratricopeptide (TPR) repeat protein
MFFWRLLLLLIFGYPSFAQKSTPKYFWEKANRLPSTALTEKLKLYEKAAKLAHNSKDFAWEANIYPDLCGAYFSLGENEKSTQVCLDGLGILNKNNIKIDSIAFKLHSSLAFCYSKTYRIGEAIKEFETANQILIKNPNVLKETALFSAYHYCNQAYMMVGLFEVENAKTLYEKALSISNTLPSKKHYAFILSNLSQYYSFLDQPEKGIEKLEEAFRVLRNLNEIDPISMSNMYYMLAMFYQKTHNINAAKHNLERSIYFAKKKSSSNENINRAIIAKANLFLELEKYEETKKTLFLVNTNTQVEKESLFEYYITYGDLCFAQSQFLAASLNYDKAFNVYFPNQNIFSISPEAVFVDRFRLYEILGRKSSVLESRYKAGKDFSHLEKSYALKKKIMEVGNSIRSFQENVDSKLFFTDKYHKNYKEAIKVGFEIFKKKPTEALKQELFELAEESKFVSLNDDLILNSRTRDSKSDSLMAIINAYQSYISYLKNQKVKDNSQINEYNLKKIGTLNELKRYNSGLYTSIFDLKAKGGTNVIPSNTFYINYILHDSDLYVFTKSQNLIEIKEIVINRKEFTENANLLLDAIQTPPNRFEGFDAEKQCEYFYRVFISEIKGINKVKRLIVNPSNIFYGISFDILKSPISGKYLIESHAISYTNSLKHTSKKITNDTKPSNEWFSFFPFSRSSQGLISGLRPLKFSLSEIKGILAVVKKDADANKITFLEALNAFEKRIILIATHAKGNDSDPYLIFDDEDQITSRLYASELRHYKVNSPMVVLSACETNKGKPLNGLGVLSFAKSLSLAGCPSVVGTFWEVEDKSMSVLSSLFYRNLTKGMDKDLALQKAKLDYLQTEIGKQNDVPFYWAHMQVIGDTSPISSSVFGYVWYFLLAIFIIFVSIFLFRNALRKFFSAKVEF